MLSAAGASAGATEPLDIVYWQAPAVGELVMQPPKGGKGQVLIVLPPSRGRPAAWNPLQGRIGYRAVYFGNQPAPGAIQELLHSIGMPHSDRAEPPPQHTPLWPYLGYAAPKMPYQTFFLPAPVAPASEAPEPGHG